MPATPTMNPERLLNDAEQRLQGFPQAVREEVLDALREAFARERRRTGPIGTVETERRRRKEAEALRLVLEAVNRCIELSDTIAEVLRQARSLLVVDSCSLLLNEATGGARIVGALGLPDEGHVVGVVVHSGMVDEVRQTRQLIAVDDALVDPRWEHIEGIPDIVRSWIGVPLLVEGDVIGLLSLDRHSISPFDDDEIRCAKTLAFTAAAAVRRGELFEKLRRYSSLLERSLDVAQAVFRGEPADGVAHLVLEGAMKLGQYPGGLLLLGAEAGPVVAAGAGTAGGGDLQGREGQPVPPALVSPVASRLAPAAAGAYAALFGVPELAHPLLLVPLAAEERPIGALALLDPNGETPDDRLLAAYASRAAAAWLYARSHS
jgi:hypothetical protein